jgi:hypothetical protein
VDQSEAVSELVDRLFFASMVEQVGVFGQSVEFLTEPVNGNDGRRIVELSFAEDERKGRHEQVYVRHSKQFCIGSGAIREQSFQKSRRVILSPSDVIGVFQTNDGIAHLTGEIHVLGEQERKELNDRGFHASDWENQYFCQAYGFLILYFFIFL